MRFRSVFSTAILAVLIFFVLNSASATAQSVASGTIEGTVTDSTGGVVVGATVDLRNPITGFHQTTTSDSAGAFRFTNIPFNPYHLQVTQQGFNPFSQDVSVRTTVPLSVNAMLSIAGVTASVSV